MNENFNLLDCTFHSGEEFRNTVNKHGFFLENQTHQIKNEHDAHYRLYVLFLENVYNVQQLELALSELQDKDTIIFFQDDYDLGVFLEGFTSVFPKIIDFHRESYSKLLQHAPFVFLINTDI